MRFLLASFALFCASLVFADDPPSPYSDKQPAETPLVLPKIDRHPPAWVWKNEPSFLDQLLSGNKKTESIPKYNPNSRNAFQVDLRGKDLSKMDLQNSLNDLLYAEFDTRTVWPTDDRMPKEYDRQRIMELGRNPGLGVRALHARGITGRGVGLAMIDQPLLVDHGEYKDRLQLYEEIHVTPDTRASMHGPAVASLAVGKTVGVAPEADLYYVATEPCDMLFVLNFSYYAKSLRRIMDINRQLPADKKIRVVAMQIGWGKSQQGYDEITAACNEAKQSGLFVVSSSLEEVHGFRFHGLGRPPLSDPEKFESYEPGLFWSKEFPPQNHFVEKFYANRLLIPMDSRTYASFAGADDYAFSRTGGWSWSIPYLAGVYALACQVDPKITPDRFWELTMKTGRTIEIDQNGKKSPLRTIIDPAALIKALEQPASGTGF